MPEYLTQQDAFLKCKREGYFVVVSEVEIEKIKSTLIIADGDVESANELKKDLPKESSKWNSVYKLYYDALHELVEAFLRFDNVTVDNHQCLFAYLCEKHPEMEFNFDFFEKVRTKRNGINYYGKLVQRDDFKEVELQFILYVNKLRKELKEKIKKY